MPYGIILVLSIIINGIFIYILGFLIHYIFKLKLKLSLFVSVIIMWTLFLNANTYDVEQNKFTILSNIQRNFNLMLNIRFFH